MLPGRPPAHVPLVHLVRDGMVEGTHFGSVVVLGPDGETVLALGEPDALVYPRSAAKPIQAAAMVRVGLDLPAAQLALAGASHSGEPAHLAVAAAVLRDGGLTEQALGNPADLPLDPVERDTWLATGRGPSPLAHNCSGKHAAMLRTCLLRGWDPATYLSPEHPLQRAVADAVTDLTGAPPGRIATDGCGAPLFATSLRGLARALGRIATAAAGTAEHAVAAAYRSHPEMVAGSRRDTTALMRQVPGLVAKDGFEAVQVAALPDGTTLAVKIADGSDRARHAVTIAALHRAGVDTDALLVAPPAGFLPSANVHLSVVDALAS